MSMRQHAIGATLIELVIAIVIIGSASVTLIGVLTAMSTQSAETMISIQAANIAKAYLDEILDKPIIDPDGVNGESRGGFDNIDDYLRLPDSDVRDRLGNSIANLDGYQVSVLIQSGGLSGVPSAQTRRVTVTVTGPLQYQTIVRGFRTRHE
jgi:type II secretory pathway pseudopilin PulG